MKHIASLLIIMEKRGRSLTLDIRELRSVFAVW